MRAAFNVHSCVRAYSDAAGGGADAVQRLFEYVFNLGEKKERKGKEMHRI